MKYVGGKYGFVALYWYQGRAMAFRRWLGSALFKASVRVFFPSKVYLGDAKTLVLLQSMFREIAEYRSKGK